MLRVGHYINQFFGQVGGEEHAGIEPYGVDGPLGPGVALQQHLNDEAVVSLTVVCGDNYFAEHTDDALRKITTLLEEAEVDLLVAGPAFSAGRYGLACARLCQAVQEELGLVAVTGFSPDNPATDMYRKDVVITVTGQTAISMKSALGRMAEIGLKLVRKEELGLPEVEGYVPHGLRRNVLDDQTGAQRAITLLRAKLAGRPIVSEIPLPEMLTEPAAPPVDDLSLIKLALATTGGLVPKGNPEGQRSNSADGFARYSIGDLDRFEPGRWEAYHGGYHTRDVNDDPNRLVPLDALRTLVEDGLLGGVHPTLYSLAGSGTNPDVGRRMAREIAPELSSAGVGGVLLTST